VIRLAKWEYKIEKFEAPLTTTGNVEQILNSNGNEGWELVNIVPQYASTSNEQNQIDDIYIQLNAFVFKREK
jgi:hypothetical protein